ncbi:MAG: tRNA dihydrouridine synthase DusB, partial [Duodenibacillus sp.]|nr:tRNA dihydrouridine synthase DusB [Duodenibacillus sp.]
MRIGDRELPSPVLLAPMAGVTDPPFRRLCLAMGAGAAVGEMVACAPGLRDTELSRRRFAAEGEPFPVVQLLGAEPAAMADAARYAAERGAACVDINFGCPARTVCGKACGAAVMADPRLAAAVMQAVREAVEVPVTVKMRLGWDEAHVNAPEIAAAAESLGLAAVTVHGRTRSQRFGGKAGYEVIQSVANALRIPVIANGDVDSPDKAIAVLAFTGAAGVMVGRAAYGNPWIFRDISRALRGERPLAPDPAARLADVAAHLDAHLAYWGGGERAVRSFRKHLRWYALREACRCGGALREACRCG